MIETIYAQLRDEARELVEVTDDNDQPLLVMSMADVHRQSLRHRVVLTLLYDTGGRLYLQRRAQSKRFYPGRWDISSTGHVHAGESREHAALRELNEELGVFPGRVTQIAHIPASPQTEHASITLFSARLGNALPCPNPSEVSEGLFVDREELESMLTHFRELLTPAILWAAEQGYLFDAPRMPLPDTAPPAPPHLHNDEEPL